MNQSFGITILDKSQIGEPSIIKIEKRNSCHGPEGDVVRVTLPADYPGGVLSQAVERMVKNVADMLNDLAGLDKKNIFKKV